MGLERAQFSSGECTGLDGHNPLRVEGLVLDQELAVLLGEDVVGHRRDVVVVPQLLAQRQHEGGLARPDRTADALHAAHHKSIKNQIKSNKNHKNLKMYK
jgi:hypothetical protein